MALTIRVQIARKNLAWWICQWREGCAMADDDRLRTEARLLLRHAAVAELRADAAELAALITELDEPLPTRTRGSQQTAIDPHAAQRA